MAETIKLKSRAVEVYDFRQVDISQFITGFTVDEAQYQKDLDRVDYYSQLIHTTPADLLALCDALDDITADNAVCVVAGQAQMEGCVDKLTSRLSV